MPDIIPSPTPYLCADIPEGALPTFLEQAIAIADRPEQDMLFLSALTACSYALPHMRMLHGKPQHTYYPNLMTLIVAPPAAGKGIMNNVRRLLAPIHAKLAFFDQLATIPANCSSAAFCELLSNNDGAAFMMETEMDVLSGTWKNDYANYSYIFRQTFEHETISKARKAPGGGISYIEIPNPRLSVLLSGTFNQLQPLIVSRENGLASRFVPYIVEDIAPFDPQVFMSNDHESPDGAAAMYQLLAQDLLVRWQTLSALDHDILWALTDEQSQQLANLFKDSYTISFEDLQMPIALDAIIKRLAVTIKRIGLILTALRLDMSTPIPDTIYCSDNDFRILALLAEKLLEHAGRMLLALPDEDTPLQAKLSDAENNALQLLSLLPDKFTKSDAVEAGKQLHVTDRTIKRYLASLCENKRIARTDRGQYQKIS